MFYKLLGMLTWKALRFYVGSKMPRKAIIGALAVLSFGIAVAVATASRRDAESE